MFVPARSAGNEKPFYIVVTVKLSLSHKITSGNSAFVVAVKRTRQGAEHKNVYCQCAVRTVQIDTRFKNLIAGCGEH